VTPADRTRFLLDYIDLLTSERVREGQGRDRRRVAGGGDEPGAPARGHDRWVINKLRALVSWYSKGLEGGSHLRVSVNGADSIDALRDSIVAHLGAPARAAAGPGVGDRTVGVS
jgi:hypothetical protein